MGNRFPAGCLLLWTLPALASAQVTAIRAGRLIDPETGTAAANQVILVEGEKIKAVGADLALPAGATVIDLGGLSVLPGLVDAHTHMAITYKDIPEHNVYYFTYINDSTALRAIQAAANGMQLLNAGFTVVRDVGNNGLYADVALRMAIEQGWLPGPTVIPSGPMIGSTGGQFWPTPEMYKQHDIMYPEYIDANSHDEIVRAVRENMLFGARTIKLCVDCKPWMYSVDDIKLAIREAAQGRLKGILEYMDEPLVSIDFVGNQHSSIFDAPSTRVIDGNFAKVVAWYDNEMGYATRVADLAVLLGR